MARGNSSTSLLPLLLLTMRTSSSLIAVVVVAAADGVADLLALPDAAAAAGGGGARAEGNLLLHGALPAAAAGSAAMSKSLSSLPPSSLLLLADCAVSITSSFSLPDGPDCCFCFLRCCWWCLGSGSGPLGFSDCNLRCARLNPVSGFSNDSPGLEEDVLRGFAKVVAVMSWSELGGGVGVGVRDGGLFGGPAEPARGRSERPGGGSELVGGARSVSVETAEDEARLRRRARSSRFGGASSMLPTGRCPHRMLGTLLG